MDLAKRLNEELVAQQAQGSGSLGSDRTVSPDSEPRARSFEHRRPHHHHHHHHSHYPRRKGKLMLVHFVKYKNEIQISFVFVTHFCFTKKSQLHFVILHGKLILKHTINILIKVILKYLMLFVI